MIYFFAVPTQLAFVSATYLTPIVSEKGSLSDRIQDQSTPPRITCVS